MFFFGTLLQSMSLVPFASVSFAFQGGHKQRPFPLQWRYLVLPYLGLLVTSFLTFFSILSLARFTVERWRSISAFCFAIYSRTFLAKTSKTLLFWESRTGGEYFRQFSLIRVRFHGRNPTTAQAFLKTDGFNALAYAL